MSTYKVIHSSDVPPHLNAGIGKRQREETWSVVRCEDDIPVEWIACDGGEPEDQILVRDWDWVAVALNAAFALGMREAK